MRQIKWLVVLAAMASISGAIPLTLANDVPWTVDTFGIELANDGSFVQGGGSGYADGTWYQYPTEWWNQWFYDDPYQPSPWYKEIQIWPASICNVDVEQDSYAEIAVNWSTPEWSLEGNPPGEPRVPPLPGVDESRYIVRETFHIYEHEADGFEVCESWPMGFHWDFLVPDYNPEWVSIDVRGYNFTIMQDGDWSIWHRCIPEPSTAGLLGVGAVALLRRRR